MSKVKVVDFEACILCGERHPSSSRCPCPRCHHVHESSICNNPCAICNRSHDGPCGGFFSNRCFTCGESHQSYVKCPCPLCFYRHPGNYCPNDKEWSMHPNNFSWTQLIADCCVMCGQRHGNHTGCPCAVCHDWHDGDDCQPYLLAVAQPCSRCNVWHGADVCHRIAVAHVPLPSLRIPREMMVHRAVAAVVAGNDARHVVAPAHSDAASDYHDIGTMSEACSHCGARFWKGESIQCCYEGSLIIPEPVIPESLSAIIMSSTVRSHLRSYNMAMAMASVGHHKRGFPDGVFTMSGRSYHRIGS